MAFEAEVGWLCPRAGGAARAAWGPVGAGRILLSQPWGASCERRGNAPGIRVAFQRLLEGVVSRLRHSAGAVTVGCFLLM